MSTLMDNVELRTVLLQEDKPPDWLVEKVFARDQLILLAGREGIGKSFLSYYLAFSVALGAPFLGFKSVQTSVIYFDEENSRPDLHEYLRSIWNGLGKPNIQQLEPFLFIKSFELAKRPDERWKYMINEAAKYNPGLIIIDTATPAFGIRDENSNAEASQAIRNVRRVQSAANNQTTVLILKHALFTHQDAQERTIRGAKTWLGEADRTFFHDGLPGRPSFGLKPTILRPQKVRAFGLNRTLRIIPQKVEKGIILQAVDFIEKTPIK